MTLNVSVPEVPSLGPDLDYATGEDAPAREALRRLEAGERCALLTIVGVDGASPRPLGAQMTVAENGDWTGYLSGGCLEQAVVQEALDTMAAGEARVVRYGKGSKYFDIVLPCGSGLDVHIDPAPDLAQLRDVVGALDARRAAQWSTVLPNQERFEKTFVPTLRFIVAGRGPGVVALLDLAAAMGFETHALSPDAAITHLAERRWTKAASLAAPEARVGLEADGYTALVLMFHDHYWETALIQSAVQTDCFYIGAMGSRNAAELRMEALVEAGLTEEQLARVRGPIGLFGGAKRPGDLALSVLAEVVGEFRARLESQVDPRAGA
ncbi:MAG: XdhC family protein [Maricaulaceae bacterium]|jgi:xanthine dehydrogenase accessory factor